MARRRRRVRYREDHKSFQAFMLSDQMRDVTAEVADDIRDAARDLAPRRKAGKPKAGTAMADRFKVKKQAGDIVVGIDYPNARVLVEIYNDARSAAPNEFGGSRNKRHAMLRRAGARYGDLKPMNKGFDA